MPGTFSQLYIHIVFGVKGRENLISNTWNKDLHRYIAGIIKGKEQKPIIVNGMPDHVHVFYWFTAIYGYFRPGKRYKK